MKKIAVILGLLVIIVLLGGSALTGIGLESDEWTAERSAQTDEKIGDVRRALAAQGIAMPERRATDEEMEVARQICAGWALLAAPASVIWGAIQYLRGRRSG